MRKIFSFAFALIISASSIADINSPEVQQALHAAVSPGDGVATDYVFTCRERDVPSVAILCDRSGNVTYLVLYIDDQSQLNTDFSVLTYLERFELIAETNISQLPIGLTNLSSLSNMKIYGDGFTIPDIDANAFPVTLSSLSVYAGSISLKNWETHGLKELTLSGSEVNFNNTQWPYVESLNLVRSESLINEDFSSFPQVTNFSWLHIFETDYARYSATRVQFPLLSDEVVEINLNRGYKDTPLTEIPSYILDIPNLQSLRIRGHAITELPERLFLIPALKHLDVGRNDLSTLPAINGSSNLEYLSLAGNKKITQVPDTIFQLAALKHLDLSENTISSLPAELFLMDNLEELLAFNNIIEDVAISSTASSLQTLNLRGNKLSNVPAELFQLDNLLTLDLGFNEITALSGVIAGNALSALQALTLSNNKLIDVPAELFQLENLLTLDLSFNELATLPEIISGSESLHTLQIRRNKITVLPESLFNHLSLRDIQASSNELSSLPENIVNSSLVNIDFTSNLFTQVPDALSSFSGLKRAVFNINKIETLGEQWKQSQSLEVLLLVANQLTELTTEMLDNLPPSLKYLSLEKNKMVGELPSFTKVNPELSLDITNNALWSTDKNVLLQYSDKNVLSRQLLPVRGIRVIEKNVKGDLISYIQWGFPLMEDIMGRTQGTHSANYSGSSSMHNDEYFSDVNPGPKISTGYKLVIEYTQGSEAGKKVTESFNCLVIFGFPLFCNLSRFSASYDTATYSSSAFSYGVKGSLADAKVTVYSTTPLNVSLQSSPTYWEGTEKHEQFVEEINYDEAQLPPPDIKGPLIKITFQKGYIAYNYLLILLAIAWVRVRRVKAPL